MAGKSVLFAVILIGLCQQLEASLFSRFLGQSRILAKQMETEEEGLCATATSAMTQRLGAISRLRGGAASTEDGSSKVKGTCIGIDLGTTYRYASSLICLLDSSYAGHEHRIAA